MTSVTQNSVTQNPTYPAQGGKLPGRLEYPDFAKGYAICTILLFHALQRMELPSFVGQAIVFGGTGVHLFFFLSGFGLSWSGKELSPVAFYRRRLGRIWIPYILALSISLFVSLVWGVFPDGWEAWLAGVGLYQMFFERWIEGFGGHFWFISTIIQLYLMYPILVVLQRRSTTLSFVLGCLAVSVAWWVIVFVLEKGALRTWNSCFLQFLWEFALGMGCAVWIRTQRVPTHLLAWWRSDRWWMWAVVGVFFSGIMLGMIVLLGPIGRIFNDIPAFIGYTALSIALFLIGGYPKRFFLWIGSFSFSLYLVHILMLELLLHGLRLYSIPFTAVWLLVFVGMALVGGLVFEALSKRVQAILGV